MEKKAIQEWKHTGNTNIDGGIGKESAGLEEKWNEWRWMQPYEWRTISVLELRIEALGRYSNELIKVTRETVSWEHLKL